MLIHSLWIALEATLECPEAAAHSMSVVVMLALEADSIVRELDFAPALRAVFLLVGVVLLEFDDACCAHHMPTPNVQRVARESQAHSACEVVVGLASRLFGHEVHVEPCDLGFIVREAIRIARWRVVASRHVDSKIET